MSTEILSIDWRLIRPLKVLFISIRGMDLYLSYVRSPELNDTIFPFYSSDVLVPFIGYCLGLPDP